jgi:RND family efflux transporter MFP subunit
MLMQHFYLGDKTLQLTLGILLPGILLAWSHAVFAVDPLQSTPAESMRPPVMFPSPAMPSPAVTPARRDFRAFSPDASNNGAEPISALQTTGEEILAVIYPRQQLLLALSVSGVVAEVPVTEGDFVTAGDLLIALEQDLERLELQRIELVLRDREIVQAAEERLTLVAEQLRLGRELYDESRSISRDELNALEMQHNLLKAELATLHLQKEREALDFAIGEGSLEKRNLRAPHTGFVTRIVVKPGEWAQAGEPIAEIVDSTESFIRFSLPNQRAQLLAIDDVVDFTVEGINAQGHISFISPVADPASGRVEIKVSFDNADGRIRPGLSARVSL